MDEVYIVEVAVTGESGFPKDAVVQIAICRMEADGSDYDTVYEDNIALDPKDVGHDALTRLEEVYGITAEILYMGEDRSEVISRVTSILKGHDCASFSKMTFSKFLCYEPWDLNCEVTFLPAISLLIPRDMLGDTDPNSLHNVYGRLCPGDPAGVGEGRSAMDMAQMSACVAMAMRRKGFY